MQTTGVFPALSAGMRHSSRRNGRYQKNDKGTTGFAINGRPPCQNHAPKSFAGRRAASHRKAYR